MPSKAQIISDIENQLHQGAPSSSAETEWEQLAFWVNYELNQLVATEINSKTAKGEMVPPVYIKRTAIETAEAEANADVDEDDERLYVTLDVDILDLNKDAGIVNVLTDEYEELKKTDVATLQQFKNLRFSKPSLANPLYYRIDDKIFVPGFKEVDAPFNKLFVDYVPKQNLLDLDDDEEVLVSALVLPELINRVVTRGKAMLYGTQPDQSNNGDDTKNLQYHTAIRRPE